MRFISSVLCILYLLLFTLLVMHNTPQISVIAQQPTFGPTCAQGATPCPTNTPTSVQLTSPPNTKAPTATPKPILPRAGTAENTLFLLMGGAILLMGGASLTFLRNKK